MSRVIENKVNEKHSLDLPGLRMLFYIHRTEFFSVYHGLDTSFDNWCTMTANSLTSRVDQHVIGSSAFVSVNT